MTMANATKKAEQVAHETIDRTRNFAEKAADKTKEQAGTIAEKAKDAASSVTEGAGQLATAVVHKADDAAAATGSGMQSLADTIRKNTPDEGIVGAASDKLADTLETGGKYLQEQGLTGLADDVSAIVKRYPMGALLVGVGIGYILARATSRS